MDAGRWAIGMFPPIRKDRNRKIQILFTVEGRDAAGTAELLSVILSSEESISMMKGEGNPGGFSLCSTKKASR